MKASFMRFEFCNGCEGSVSYKAFLGKLIDHTKSIPDQFRDRLNLFLILIDDLYPESGIINISTTGRDFEIEFSFDSIKADPDQDIIERLGFSVNQTEQSITGKAVMLICEEIFN